MTDPRLRVLMVTPLSPLQSGGVQRYVWEISTRMLGRGLDVEILCSDPDGDQPPYQSRDGVPVRSVRSWPTGRDWCFAPGLWRQMAIRPFDVIHVQSYHTLVAPLAMLRALTLQTPYCLTFHGGGHSSELRNRARPVQRRLLRPLLARATALVAIARFEADLYSRELKIPRERFRVIPVGTDLKVPPEALREPQNGGVVIASIGRLERYKGHHRVIEALPHVLQSSADATVLIVGRGPYEAELRTRASELGVGDQVQFTSVPPGDTDAMASLLSRVSLVALMSEFETQPQVALEAAAAHRRLLVADDGAGLKEFADDGFARALPLGSSPSDLAAAIIEELRRPQPSQRPKLSSWDDSVEQLVALYRTVVKRPGQDGGGIGLRAR